MQRAVGLVRGAERLGAEREQLVTRHLEEAHRVVVALDEAVEVGVVDDDRLRRVLDQRPVARLAVAQRRLRELALGRVAQADDVDLAPVEAHLAHADLGVEQRPVGAPAAGLARREVDLRVVDRVGEFVERLDERSGPRQRRDQLVELAAARGGLVVAEHALGRAVHRLDPAARADGQDRVLDVVDDQLELGGIFGTGQVVRRRRERERGHLRRTAGLCVPGPGGATLPVRPGSCSMVLPRSGRPDAWTGAGMVGRGGARGV